MKAKNAALAFVDSVDQQIRGMRGRVKRQVFLLTQLARGRLKRGYCTICDCGVWFNETGHGLGISTCARDADHPS